MNRGRPKRQHEHKGIILRGGRSQWATFRCGSLDVEGRLQPLAVDQDTHLTRVIQDCKRGRN